VATSDFDIADAPVGREPETSGRRRTDLSEKVVGGMTIPGRAHVVSLGQGRTVDLGVAHMRVLASGEATNGGAFALTEFSGTAEGAWTVPHLHRGFEESFFILDGLFTFTIGEEAIAASQECTSSSRGAPPTRSAQPQAEAGSCS